MARPFNVEHAIFGGLRTGLYVGLANANMGFTLAVLSGLKQVPLSFVMIGVNVHIFERLSSVNRVVAVLVPSLLSAIVSFALHTFTMTPNPFLSALAVFVVALVSFTLLSVVHETHGTISFVKLFRKLRAYMQRNA